MGQARAADDLHGGAPADAAASAPAGSALVSVEVLDGPGRPVDELLHAIAREAASGALGSSLHSTRRQLAKSSKSKVEVLNATVHPSHLVVHDERSFAQRQREAQVQLPQARAASRQLEGAKEAARAAQVQLWKLQGQEECVPQCCDPLLVQLKAQASEEREVLLAEVQRHGQSAPLAAPQLAPCASSGRARWPRAARHSQGGPRPVRSQPRSQRARASRLQSRALRCV